MAISMLDYMNQAVQPRKKALVQKITNESVFMNILNFIPVDGFSYEYGEQTTLGTIAFRSLNQNYAEDVGIVNPRSEPLKIFGGAVNTDHQLVNKQGDVARANSILAKVRRAGLFFDKAVIDGDNSVDANSFVGPNSRLINKQLLTCGVNGDLLTTRLVDDLIDRVIGKNKVLIMNKMTRRNLKHEMLSGQVAMNLSDLNGSLDSYDGIPIKVIDEDGDDVVILGYDETVGTSNNCASMYCVSLGSDVDGELMQGLVSGNNIDTYPSGMNGVFHVDIIEANMGIALFHGRSAARLQGILPELESIQDSMQFVDPSRVM